MVVGAIVVCVLAEVVMAPVVEVALRAVSSLLQPTESSSAAQQRHRSSGSRRGRASTSPTVAVWSVPRRAFEDQWYVSIAAVAAPRYPPPNLIACTTSGAIWCNATRSAQPSARGNTSS